MSDRNRTRAQIEADAKALTEALATVPRGEAVTLQQLRRMLPISAPATAATLKALRHAGKVEWTRIALMPGMWATMQGEAEPEPQPRSLAETVAQEARDSAVRRAAARSTGSVHQASSLDARQARIDGAALQALALGDPMEAARVLREAWGDLWPAVVAHGRATGLRPVQAMVALIEAGLAAGEAE